MLDADRHDRSLRVGSDMEASISPSSTVLGAEATWFSENNDEVALFFTHHWPDSPNLGDISTNDWGDVPPVDVLAGRFQWHDDRDVC